MSQWNIAAAQYAPQHNHVADHVEHHLRFIDAAASQQCDLLVFPELSLTGPAPRQAPLPEPPDDRQLAPLLQAAQHHDISIIAGITLEASGERRKGLALFSPVKKRILRYPPGFGACLVPGMPRLSIVDNPDDGTDLDPMATLFASSLAVSDTRWRETVSRMQRFAHRYAISVLMANARGGSSLWDARGQLIVRADRGELLLTGSWSQQGWQGDLIPLR